MFTNVTTGELLRLVTWITRDSAVIWTLATAFASLLAVSAKQLRTRTVTGGVLVWFVALGGYLSPVDESQFFDRRAVYLLLMLSLVLWALVFANLVASAARQRLAR